MASTADGIIEATRHNDIAGTVFQRLIADRKTLKTYYTTPEATTLLTHLAIPENLDWGNPETLKGYRIADYACGSGRHHVGSLPTRQGPAPSPRWRPR